MQWLIDGHNLIGQLPDLRLDDPNDEEKLLERLRSFRAITGNALVVVFDSGSGYHPAKTQKRGGITVQFAPGGQTADQVIVRRLRKIKNPREVTVVTSDRAVQREARYALVKVMSAQQFIQQKLLSPASATDISDVDEGSQANVRLSADEVEAWLTLFNRPKDE